MESATQTENSQATAHVQEAISAAVTHFFERFLANTKRIQGLLDLHENHAGSALLRETQNDILRSAVVFMHASLEELLRQLAATFLPLADAKSLDAIPLAGSKAGARAAKFLLGSLAEHRGKSVDHLLQESVREHLERSTYGDTDDIARLLESINFDTDEIAQFLGDLGRMMQRRHQIVHRADVAQVAPGTSEQLQDLAFIEVADWLRAVRGFARMVVTLAVKRKLVNEGVVRLVQSEPRR